MFFIKGPNERNLESFRKGFSPLKAHWFALEMNQNMGPESFESYRLEYQEEQKPIITQISWERHEEGIETSATLKGRKIFSGRIDKENNELYQSFTLGSEGLLHQFFEQVRERLVECGQRQSEAVPNLQEPQGHEWLRVSLEILRKALTDVAGQKQKGGPEVCQGLLFCGRHPTRGQFIFRLRVFNLDIEAVEDEKNSLRVQVLDKKNAESFKGIEPNFQNVFNRQKAPVLDQFIQLLPPLALAILSHQE